MRRPLVLVSAVAALALLGVSAPGPAAGVGPAAPTQGLVMHYAFETLVNGVVTDSAGNDLDGHVVAAIGSPSLVTSLSGYGKAIFLIGVNH